MDGIEARHALADVKAGGPRRAKQERAIEHGAILDMHLAAHRVPSAAKVADVTIQLYRMPVAEVPLIWTSSVVTSSQIMFAADSIVTLLGEALSTSMMKYALFCPTWMLPRDAE